MEMISRKKFFQFLIFPKERWDLLLGKEGQQFCQLSSLASNNLSLSLGLVNTCLFWYISGSIVPLSVLIFKCVCVFSAEILTGGPKGPPDKVRMSSSCTMWFISSSFFSYLRLFLTCCLVVWYWFINISIYFFVSGTFHTSTLNMFNFCCCTPVVVNVMSMTCNQSCYGFNWESLWSLETFCSRLIWSSSTVWHSIIFFLNLLFNLPFFVFNFKHDLHMKTLLGLSFHVFM